jgi:hypothetical protein
MEGHLFRLFLYAVALLVLAAVWLLPRSWRGGTQPAR